MHSENVAAFSMVLDGCAMKMVFKGEMMGMAFTGNQLFTYNRNSGKYQSVWIDDMGAPCCVGCPHSTRYPPARG